MKKIILFLCLFSSSNLWAFRIIPMTLELNKDRTSEYITIENEAGKATSNVPVAILVSATLRQVKINGDEQRPATELLRVFPNQFMLKPGETRRVKVTYTGDKEVKEEVAFRVIAEQLAVEGDQSKQKNKGSGINILLKYVAAVYFSPLDAKAQLEAKATVEASKQKDKSIVMLKIKNAGTGHAIIKKPRLTLGQDATTLANLDGEFLAPIVGQNFLAGGEREFKLEIPTSLLPGKIGKGPAQLKGTLQDQ